MCLGLSFAGATALALLPQGVVMSAWLAFRAGRTRRRRHAGRLARSIATGIGTFALGLLVTIGVGGISEVASPALGTAVPAKSSLFVASMLAFAVASAVWSPSAGRRLVVAGLAAGIPTTFGLAGLIGSALASDRSHEVPIWAALGAVGVGIAALVALRPELVTGRASEP